MKKPELILFYKENRYGGTPISDDPWSECEPEHIEWSPRRVYIDEKSKKAREKVKDWYVESLEYCGRIKKGDVVWLVVVRHSTSGSFLTTHGWWCIEFCSKSGRKANRIVKLIEQDRSAYYKHKWNGSRTKFKRKYYSTHCWCLDDLEDVTMESFVVE